MAGKSEKFILTDEEEIDSSNKLISLNPQLGKSFDNYLKIISPGYYKICLYKWFTGLDEDIYVTQSHLYKHLNDNSKLVKITPQIYYDIIVLGLTILIIVLNVRYVEKYLDGMVLKEVI